MKVSGFLKKTGRSLGSLARVFLNGGPFEGEDTVDPGKEERRNRYLFDRILIDAYLYYTSIIHADNFKDFP